MMIFKKCYSIAIKFTNFEAIECGYSHVESFKNNRPVADFFCPKCSNEYEFKSKSGKLGKKINDGTYEAMIERISSNQNPNFFLFKLLKRRINNQRFNIYN